MSKLCQVILPIGLLLLGLSPAMASYGTDMGPVCEKGETIFYGKMTRTGAEEKLCKNNDFYYFWTQGGGYVDPIGVVIKHVKEVSFQGSIGYSRGYDLTMYSNDVIQFRATYSKQDMSPLAGFFIFNENIAELEPASIYLK